jgi:hypothetical protein
MGVFWSSEDGIAETPAISTNEYQQRRTTMKTMLNRGPFRMIDKRLKHHRNDHYRALQLWIALLPFLILGGECQAFPDAAEILAGASLAATAQDQYATNFQPTNGELILVNVQLNGRPEEFTFILDTGAGVMVVSTRVADTLGLPKESEFSLKDITNQTQTVDVVQLGSFRLGDIEFTNVGAIVTDLEGVKALGGPKLDGIIGTNLLRFFILEIDYVAKTVHFSTKNRVGEHENLGYAIPISYKANFPLSTKIKLADDTLIDAGIDTGVNGPFLTIPKEKLPTLTPLLTCPVVRSKGIMTGGVFGVSESAVSRINTMQLGDLQLQNLPVQFSDIGFFNLSNGFLSHFHVIINYPDSQMYLRPLEERPFETNIVSFGYMAPPNAAGERRIIGIWEGSAAAQHGLQVGDVLVSETYTDPETVHLVIRHEETQKEIVLHRSELLPE